MNATSLPEAFRHTAAAQGDAPAVCLPGRSVSFAEMDAASERIAVGLAARGIGKGDRVGLYCINCPEFAMVYLGILKAGATVVPLNLLQSPREINYILGDCGARALAYHPLMAEKAAQAREGLKDLELGVLIGETGGASGDALLRDLLAAEGTAPTLSVDPSEDVAAVIYTSGTTGYPKGAQLTHANLLANTSSVCRALRLRAREDVMLVVLPMFHSFAATVGMLTPLLHGQSFAPVPKFEPALVCDIIGATGATVFLGVPSMFTVLLRMTEVQRAQWRTVRFCISGGSALPVPVLQGFEQLLGIPVLEGDGPTECSPVTCVNPLDGPRKPGSVGLPIPDVEMRVTNEQGETVPDTEMGEICVRGPNVMKGYWNRPEADAESFFGDWFRTGDLGYRDTEGYFFLIDRIKDMIIVNGMNVYPRMVEEALYRHPAVAEAAVVGEHHETHGEIPVAYLVPKEGMTLDPGEIRAWCRDHLGRHEVPRRVVVRDALPRNAAGKILKRELRRQGELERGVDNRPAEG